MDYFSISEHYFTVAGLLSGYSLAYELGLDYSSSGDDGIDLSELQLAWFSLTALPDDCEVVPSQAGEGYYAIYDKDTDDIIEKTLNCGGFANYATTIYSAGIA